MSNEPLIVYPTYLQRTASAMRLAQKAHDSLKVNPLDAKRREEAKTSLKQALNEIATALETL